MKISEYAKVLNGVMDKFGDIELFVERGFNEHPSELLPVEPPVVVETKVVEAHFGRTERIITQFVYDGLEVNREELVGLIYQYTVYDD